MSTFDVIIPFYNTRLEYMREAVNSVLAQTYPNWIAYVVNDGSSEQSSHELEAFLTECADPRIVYISQENRGLSGARNAGIRRGKSPYVAILDSDDLWFPDKLATQLPILDHDPSVIVSCATADEIIGEQVLPYQTGRLSWMVNADPEELFIRVLQNNTIGGNSAVFRRHEAEMAGLYDESFDCMEDKEFWLRLMLCGYRFHYLEVPLGIYRLHPESLSRKTEKMFRGRMRLIEKLDRTIGQAPTSWTRLDWPVSRAGMIRNAYIEAGEESIASGDYHKAIYYSLPNRSGLSHRSGLLALRSVYGAVRSAFGLGK